MATSPNLYKDDGGKTVNATESKSTEGKAAPDGRRALYWREIERYNRSVNDWHQEGDNVVELYLDKNRTEGSTKRTFNMLWANTEVLKPAVYAKLPTIVVERRHKDRDPVGRIAAELMERAGNVTLEVYNVHETFRLVRDDRLLPGRGQGWVRYDATIEQYEDGADDDDVGGEDGQSDDTIEDPKKDQEVSISERIADEKVCVEYVHWKDFGHNIARTWNEVWVVWRIVFKTQDEVAERFGGDVAAKLAYNAKLPASGSGAATDDPDGRAKIYEIWDKKRNLTSWIADGYDDFLEIGKPPIKFELGFPCPEPCYGTKSSKEMIPRPDYTFYRDQAREINDLTEKIHNMSEYLIVKGFIPSAPSSVADPIQEALRDKGNREMFLEVDSMSEWSEKGGINKLIDWFPIEKIQQAIQGAIAMRTQLIQDVYQLTGISDIMRSQSSPSETLGAQELKMQTGTNRLRNTKDDIARFTRDISRLVCEVIADVFQPETIAQMTGFQYIPTPPPQPMLQLSGPGSPLPMLQGLPNPGPAIGQSMGQPAPMPIGAPIAPQQPVGMLPPRFGLPNLPTPPPQMGANGGPPMGGDPSMGGAGQGPDMTFDDNVMAVLRNDRMRGFRIDIETDSTVMADEQAEKQSRMEFLGAVGPYMQQAVQAVEMAPALAPAYAEMLMFVVRGFHVGSGLEETIEKSFQAMAMQAMQAKSQPNPVIALKTQEIQSRTQAEQAKTDATNQRTQVDASLEANQQRQDAALEVRKQNLDHHTEMRHQDMDAHAQVQDRHARLLAALKPSSTRQ